MTRAWESMTAVELSAAPMAQVHAAWKTVLNEFRIEVKISSSVRTAGPGYCSAPINTGFITGLLRSCRARLNAATATCTSVGSVSQLGLMMGRSEVSADAKSTVPLERGATRAVATVA